MLIKFDGKTGLWTCTAVIDGQSIVVMGTNMRRVLELMTKARLAPVTDTVCHGGFVAYTDGMGARHT